VDTATTASFLLHDGKKAHPIAKLSIFRLLGAAGAAVACPPLPSNGLPAQLELKERPAF